MGSRNLRDEPHGRILYDTLIEETEDYAAWFESLRDRTTRMRIDIRIAKRNADGL